VGDLPAVLDDGDLGVLVEPGDAVALADAVARLRADTLARERLRRWGRLRAVQRHDWSGVVERVLSLAGLPGLAGLPAEGVPHAVSR
jgi:glycosyltransferase involved in cell wall biosynthesis